MAAAARKHVQLKLYLVRLSDADLMDLGPVLATSLEEAREAERQKVAVDGDGWGELEPESLPMQQFIAFNEIRWPFRVRSGSQTQPSATFPHPHLLLSVYPSNMSTNTPPLYSFNNRMACSAGSCPGSSRLPGPPAWDALARRSRPVQQWEATPPLEPTDGHVDCARVVFKGAPLAGAMDILPV